jgi:hypothetical protein
MGKRSIIMREFDKEGTVVGVPYQSVMEESAVARYPIGTLYEKFGARWRYCKAYEAITIPHRGCAAMQPASWTAGVMSMGSDSTTVTGIKDDTKVLIFTGGDYDIAHAVDYFQGGMMVIFTATEIQQHRIIGNDASFTSNTYMYIYIEPGLLVARDGIACDVMSNPYAFVGSSASVGTGESVVCVPQITVQSGYYFWGQTKGPCFVTPSTEWKTASTRMAEFGVGGTIKAGTGVALQIAGFQIYDTTDDEDSYIMLMLE